jgi:hypothetical protein
MSKSKFEELTEISKADHTNTYAYLEETFHFIKTLGHNLANYLDCDSSKIFILDSEGKEAQIDSFIPNSVIFDDDGFFKFNLQVQIVETPFNVNSSGNSFFQKSLAPPSGVILPISIKNLINKSFIVKSFAIEKEGSPSKSTDYETDYEFDHSEPSQEIIDKSFTINSNDDTSWSDFLESSFQVMKKIVQENLEQRISKLCATRTTINSPSQSAFGFRLVEQRKPE